VLDRLAPIAWNAGSAARNPGKAHGLQPVGLTPFPCTIHSPRRQRAARTPAREALQPCRS
jgi:hypothetical protein